MQDVRVLGERAQRAARQMGQSKETAKNAALLKMADALEQQADAIMRANEDDIDNARRKGISASMIDRLTLTRERIGQMADGVRAVVALSDPIGRVLGMWERPNGLRIGKQRVPLGVIAIIYESRPNVTVDAAVLCLKAGNAVVLRGGSEAIRSNTALVKVLRAAAAISGLPEDAVQIVEDTSHETAQALMKANGLIDVLIPRGGEKLIRTVVEHATVPVIETGTGVCHVYVDARSDLAMADKIIFNAKVSRPSTCNAAETLLVHQSVAEAFLPRALSHLQTQGHVEIRGCERTRAIVSGIAEASEADWSTEYNDYILSVKVVEDIEEAYEHIARYGTKHSEAIVTDDYATAQDFLQRVDAAAVYVNASTRFTDGFEFGLGAEIGISNQKLHARGPMGLEELTTVKYIIYGNGQVR